MAAPGNVAPTARARLALGVGIGDLLAVRAEPQRASVDLGQEGVAAGAASGDEALQLGEPLGLTFAPAQVVAPQPVLLGSGFGSRRSPPRGGGSPLAIASPFRVGQR